MTAGVRKSLNGFFFLKEFKFFKILLKNSVSGIRGGLGKCSWEPWSQGTGKRNSCSPSRT